MILSDKQIIKNALYGVDIKSNQKKIFKPTLRISQNPSEISSNELAKIQNTMQFKINCLDEMYESHNNFLLNILKTKNVKDYINSSIRENIKDISNTSENVFLASSNIIKITEEADLKNVLIKSFSNKNKVKNFGHLYNHFDENILNSKTKENYNSDEFVFIDQLNLVSLNDTSLVDNINVKKHFLFNLDILENSISNLSYEKSANISTFITQQFINLTRSLSTLYVGCVPGLDSNLSIDIVSPINNIMCLTSENDEINIFSHINKNNFSFDYDSFLANNNINISTATIDKIQFYRPRTSGTSNSQTGEYIQKNYQDILYSDYFFTPKFVSNDFYNNNVVATNEVQEEVENLNKLFVDFYNTNLNLSDRNSFRNFKKFLIDEKSLRGDFLQGASQWLVIDRGLSNSDRREGTTSRLATYNAYSKIYYTSLLNLSSIYESSNLNYLNLEQSPSGYEEQYRISSQPYYDNQKIKVNEKIITFKADSLVKSVKIKALNQSNVDITFLKEINENISLKKTKNYIASYIKNETSNINVVKENNLIFDFLYSKDEENNIYSNFNSYSLNGEKSNIEYIKDKSEKNINNRLKEFYLNYKNLVSNYYKGDIVKTSFNYLKYIVSSVNKEIAINTSLNNDNYYKIALCQILYFNYINNKNENYEAILQRFLKNAIKKYGNCSSSIRNNKLESFRFNDNDIKISDFNVYYDDVSQGESQEPLKRQKIKELEEKYFDSSEEMYKIINTVFSLENIVDISNKTSKSRIGNINFNVFSNSRFEESFSRAEEYFYNEPNLSRAVIAEYVNRAIRDSDLVITFDITKNILPFVFIKSNRKINIEGDFSIYKNEFELEHNVKSCFEFEENRVRLNDDLNHFNYIVKKSNNQFLLNLSVKNEKLILEDFFDEIVSKENDSFCYSFSSILKILKDIINVTDGNFKDLEILSEEDIENYITDNSHLLDYTHQVLSLFSDIYLKSILSLNDEISLEMLSLDGILSCDSANQIKKYNTQDLGSLNNTNLFKIYNFDNIFNERIYSSSPEAVYFNYHGKLLYPHDFYNNIFQGSYFKHSIKYTSSNIINLACNSFIKRFYSIFQNFKLDYDSSELIIESELLNNLVSFESYIDKNKISNISNENAKDNFVNSIFNSLNTLIKSDTYQSLNFDMIKLFCEHFIKNIDQKDINYIYEEIRFLPSDIDKGNLLLNTLNDLSLNRLCYQNQINSKIFKDVTENYLLSDSGVSTSDNNISTVFNKIKEYRKTDFINISSSSSDNNDYKNDLFYYSIDTKELQNINCNSLIKVKIQAFNHGNINKMYFPKYLYFSPLLFNPKYLLFNTGITNYSNYLGQYNVYSDSIKQRVDTLDLSNNTSLQLRDVISRQFEIVDENTINLIVDSIIQNHQKSFEIEKKINGLYNIDISNSKILQSKISLKTYNLINDISEFDFLNSFGVKKNNFINECLSIDVDDEKSYNLSYDNIKYLKVCDFFYNIDYIISSQMQIDLINNIEKSKYQNICFGIDISNFFYKDWKKTRSEEILTQATNGSILNFESLDFLDTFFIEKDLNKELDDSIKSAVHKKEINYENYSLIIDFEVL